MQEDTPIPAAEDFFHVPNFEAQLQETAMPLLSLRGDNLVQIGTGFIINEYGLMMTASHVIKDAENYTRRLNDAGEYYDHIEMYAVYVANQREGLKPEERIGGTIRLEKAWINEEHDIALCFLEPTYFEGKRVFFPPVTISPGLPTEGENIIGFGYPGNPIDNEGDSEFVKYYHRNAFARGQIIKNYEERRDRGSLNFPCFYTNARFEHAMSGGPIFNENARVCGVICKGMDPVEGDPRYISYGALIGAALTVELEIAFGGNPETENLTLYDLVERGYIITDDTIYCVEIKKRESKEGQPIKDVDFSWYR